MRNVQRTGNAARTTASEYLRHSITCLEPHGQGGGPVKAKRLAGFSRFHQGEPHGLPDSKVFVTAGSHPRITCLAVKAGGGQADSFPASR